MKTAVLIIISAAVGFATAWFIAQPSNEAYSKSQPLYWVAPMDPNYRREKPGLSPMGMDLVPVFENIKTADNSVSIDPTVQHNLGLKVADAKFDILPQRINTTGYIQINEANIGHVHSRVDGWVEKLYPSSVGDFIKKGEPLYNLYSPLLVSGQEEFISALGSNNPQLIEVSKKRLSLLGLNQQQLETLIKNPKVEKNITIYSQHSGYINKLGIREGMYIRPDTEMLSIADLSSVWMIAEVFERQSMLLKKGQAVAISADGLPGLQWQATVDYIYPVLNPQSRTVQVRVVLDNPNMALKPNMFVHVSIDTSQIKKTLFVPRSAVIRGGHGDRVVKKIDETHFQSVAVATGVSNSQSIEIIDGLTANDTVVVSAHFLIDSESNIGSELNKLTSAIHKSHTSDIHDAAIKNPPTQQYHHNQDHRKKSPQQ